MKTQKTSLLRELSRFLFIGAQNCVIFEILRARRASFFRIHVTNTPEYPRHHQKIDNGLNRGRRAMLVLQGIKTAPQLNGAIVDYKKPKVIEEGDRVVVVLQHNICPKFHASKELRVRVTCVVEQDEDKENSDPNRGRDRSRSPRKDTLSLLTGHDLIKRDSELLALNSPTIEVESRIYYKKESKTVFKQSIMVRLVVADTEVKFLIFLTSEEKGLLFF